MKKASGKCEMSFQMIRMSKYLLSLGRIIRSDIWYSQNDTKIPREMSGSRDYTQLENGDILVYLVAGACLIFFNGINSCMVDTGVNFTVVTVHKHSRIIL